VQLTLVETWEEEGAEIKIHKEKVDLVKDQNKSKADKFMRKNNKKNALRAWFNVIQMQISLKNRFGIMNGNLGYLNKHFAI
jgi:hypothetical protein